MSQVFPVIRYTGLFAYVEAYAKGTWAYPVLSLFGAKTSVRAIASALVSRKSELYINHVKRTQEVYLIPGDYRIFCKTLPCGACHALVINRQALLKHCSPPSFYIVRRREEQGPLPSRFFTFLDRLVPVPLLGGWADWLWKRGLEKGEIEALDGFQLTAYECRVDLDGLKRDLSEAIKKKQLQLKESRNEIGRKMQGRILSDAALRG